MPWIWETWRQRRMPAPSPAPAALTAAATEVKTGGERLYLQPEAWQDEVWTFYDELGEFRYGVDWFAEAMSRVRLVAARQVPGQDEPEILESGPAVDLVSELAGGVAGRAAMMSRLATLLSVPGEGYVLGETIGTENFWDVKSGHEIRSRTGDIEIVDNERSRAGKEVWRKVAPSRMLTRVWRPHPRMAYLAHSPARSARHIMRELELVNRHIQAQYLSRLASAGIVVLPDEVTFPVRTEFEDATDPFVAEWIEIAKEAIANPGTASAVVPIPMRVPGEYVDKVKHLDFTLALDEKIIEKRDSAIRRLATEMDMPAEVLLGMGDTNHWTAWQLDESAIKIHISPTAEIITQCLTNGYLIPRLKAAGALAGDEVLWYDTSELTQRPDRSENAVKVYDRNELSGDALRRETGFDEADAPTDEELADQITKYAARHTSLIPGVLEQLTGNAMIVTPPAGDQGGSEPDEDRPADGPPDTRDEPPPGPDEPRPVAAALTPAFAERHRIVVEFGGGWRVLHPDDCGGHQFLCPVTWAAFRHPGFGPGTPGRYRLRMVDGNLSVGERALGEFNGLHVTGKVR